MNRAYVIGDNKQDRKRKTHYVVTFLPVTCIALLVLAQGGYFGLATCFVGTLACVAAAVAWLRKARRGRALSGVPLLFCCVAVSFLVSAIVAGASLTTLAEVGAWATCAAVSLLAAAQDGDERSRSLTALCWFGVATAVAGAFVNAGVLALPGAMVEDRLQFTFQYANAAGAWYAACTLLCILAPDHRLRDVALVPATGMLLTQSGGTLVVFSVAACAIGIQWAKGGEWRKLFDALLQGAVAGVLFALCRIVPALGALVLPAMLLLSLRYRETTRAWVASLDARKCTIAILVILGMFFVLGTLLLPTRVNAALRSVSERACQVRDGLALWSASPLLGIGPDNWQYLYPYIQTAVYQTTVVHSSLVQLLLDAGLVGVVLFAGACAVGLRGLQRDVREDDGDGWSFASLCAALLLLAYSAIEFDLQFSSLTCLLALLLSGPAGPRATPRRRMREAARGGLAAGLASILVCLPLCGVGALCAASSTALVIANRDGELGRCVRMFEENPLARADAAAQSEYLLAVYSLGDSDMVTRFYETMFAPNDRDALYAAVSYYRQGMEQEATADMIGRLESRPYDLAYLDGALELADRYGVDEAQRTHFDVAAQDVRTHATDAAA